MAERLFLPTLIAQITSGRISLHITAHDDYGSVIKTQIFQIETELLLLLPFFFFTRAGHARFPRA